MRTVIIAAITAFLAFLAGCAMSSETYLPSGQKGYTISCDGVMLNYGDCYKKAGQLCGALGYDIVGDSGESHGMASVQPTFGFAGNVVTRSLVVGCKPRSSS